MESKLNISSSRVEQVLDSVSKELDFNKLLEKYGPEGLYIIADKLKEIADNDVNEAFKQANNDFSI